MERLGGKALCLILEHLEALCQTQIVQLGHLLTCILLQLNLVLELSCIQEQLVNFILMLHKDFALEFCAEFDFLLGKSLDKLVVRVLSPSIKQVLESLVLLVGLGGTVDSLQATSALRILTPH